VQRVYKELPPGPEMCELCHDTQSAGLLLYSSVWSMYELLNEYMLGTVSWLALQAIIDTALYSASTVSFLGQH